MAKYKAEKKKAISARSLLDPFEETDKYQVQKRFDGAFFTYGSPIFFQECTFIKRGENGDRGNRVCLQFVNVDYKNRTIRNIRTSVRVYETAKDKDEGNFVEVSHKYVSMNLKYLKGQGDESKIHVKNDQVYSIEIKVDEVEFTDGTTWSSQEYYDNIPAIEDVESFADDYRNNYQETYAKGVELIENDVPEDIEKGKKILEGILWYEDTEEIIETADKKHEAAVFARNRRAAREQRRIKREQALLKRKKIVKTVIVVAIVVALVAVFGFVIPNARYSKGYVYLRSKNYAKAVDIFSGMNGFRKSEDYLAEAYYNLGLKAFDAKNTKKAKENFTNGVNSSSSSEFGKMCQAYLDYYKGEDMFEQKKYDEAQKLFEKSADAATDYTLINKAGDGTAKVAFIKKEYEKAWKIIKNVYAKDKKTYADSYGTYGYAYAKSLLDSGKVKEGMAIYDKVAKLTKATNLNDGVYKQAVRQAEIGKMDEAINLLDTVRKNYQQAEDLYGKIVNFRDTTQFWLGTWKHTGKVNGEKKTYTITIGAVLYKGDMCLKIRDMNNKTLGFDTVISSKNRVTQIEVATYRIHFKLKKFHDQKFTYTLKGGKKMIRELRYGGDTFKTKYKKK